ncbi:myosin IC heavy chain-like [Dermochelys coriacea]|uniref:myosin IC heavy chain-like n=1 Tax=Dermochelys coriacea TaxID=27794 RepID=UPI001CA953DE|nr:myosin IC heavy chain-like [Dermochelys coriacea]
MEELARFAVDLPMPTLHQNSLDGTFRHGLVLSPSLHHGEREIRSPPRLSAPRASAHEGPPPAPPHQGTKAAARRRDRARERLPYPARLAPPGDGRGALCPAGRAAAGGPSALAPPAVQRPCSCGKRRCFPVPAWGSLPPAAGGWALAPGWMPRGAGREGRSQSSPRGRRSELASPQAQAQEPHAAAWSPERLPAPRKLAATGGAGEFSSEEIT